MFNWFGRRYKTPERYPTWADIPPPQEYPAMPEVETPKKEFSEDGYSIGPGNDGYCAILKLKSGYSTISMQMNEQSVRQMIKLLEATLPEHVEAEQK